MKFSFHSLGAALVTGQSAFVSPCSLPLVPAYLSYIKEFLIVKLSNGEAGGRRQQIVLSAFGVGAFLGSILHLGLEQ